ncbi:MAG: cyclic nucleotide-binding domain-containing protein [Candidatus Brocadiales bacterium]|nr:cyclic nucleotide-binding domain-containing protein [Candidatus Brocadiales bacterium]
MNQSFKAGDVIIKQGSYDTSAYIIESGKVEVSFTVNDKKTVFAILGQKQIFGEMALMDDKARSATVMALEDTLVSVIDRKGFNEQLAKNPKVLFPIIKALFERLRMANQNIAIKECLGVQAFGSKQKEPEKKGLIVLSGMNETATDALGNYTPRIESFPYKVGRKSAIGGDDIFVDNDLFLEDNTEKPPFNISSNHFLIDLVSEKYVVVDRGSSFGTIVNGTKIEEPYVLDKKVNKIVVGSEDSPFIFKLEIK